MQSSRLFKEAALQEFNYSRLLLRQLTMVREVFAESEIVAPTAAVGKHRAPDTKSCAFTKSATSLVVVTADCGV
jgi:hypothetical protein